MTLTEFIGSTVSGVLPEVVTASSPCLLALWYERRGDWERAHDIVQEIETDSASLVHAYLHRREGDESNARYWYRQAGRHFPVALALDEEWEQLAGELLVSA